MPDWWLMTFSCSVMINSSTKCLIVQSCIIMYKTVYYLLFPSWGPIISLTLWPFLSDLIVSAEYFCRIRILISILMYVPALSYLYANRVSLMFLVGTTFFSQFFQFLIVFPCSHHQDWQNVWCLTNKSSCLVWARSEGLLKVCIEQDKQNKIFVV